MNAFAISLSATYVETMMAKRLPKEEYEKENERLRKENERLRLENLLLKKSESLSRGKRSPRQSDWAQAIEELRRNEHAEPGLLLELKKMALPACCISEKPEESWHHPEYVT